LSSIAETKPRGLDAFTCVEFLIHGPLRKLSIVVF
jgi:hypothetical protein